MRSSINPDQVIIFFHEFQDLCKSTFQGDQIQILHGSSFGHAEGQSPFTFRFFRSGIDLCCDFDFPGQYSLKGFFSEY